MSAPVYVGKHRDSEWCARPEVLALSEVLHRLDRETLIRLAYRRTEPTLRHYKPCPDCRDTGIRFVSVSSPNPLLTMSTQTRCHCGATPPQLMNAPVAAKPSSAVAVKAGGVATLTGGDTTQPETQR